MRLYAFGVVGGTRVGMTKNNNDLAVNNAFLRVSPPGVTATASPVPIVVQYSAMKKFVPPLLRKPPTTTPAGEPPPKKPKLDTKAGPEAPKRRTTTPTNPIKLISATKRKPLLLVKNLAAKPAPPSAVTSTTPVQGGSQAGGTEAYYNVLWCDQPSPLFNLLIQ
jgi:hypothetical protein